MADKKAVLTEEQNFAAQLATKLLKVMDDVKSVVKDGRNSFHGYKFASDAAILTAVRKAMIQHKVIALPNQLSCDRTLGTKGKKSEAELDFTTVCVEYTIIDAETGYATTCRAYGQGQDAGDKGAYKAATGAEKYFLLKALMIPTEDDPENEPAPASAARQAANKGATPPSAAKDAPKASNAEITDSEESKISADEIIEAIKACATFVDLEKLGKGLVKGVEKFSEPLKQKVRDAYTAEKKRFQKLQK